MAQVRNEGQQILKVLCGSRAYGLHDEHSDYDYHSVFVIPTQRFFVIGAGALKNTQWVEGDAEDNTGWELGHFLALAAHCNPTVLETFVAPVAETTPLGEELRELFPYVLDRRRIYDAFRGYANSQRKKMFEPGASMPERRKRKAAIAWLRSLRHGTDLLAKGTYETDDIPDDLFDFLMLLRDEEQPWRPGDVVTLAQMMEDGIRIAYEHSVVREHPDWGLLNEWLLDVRKGFWDA